MKWAIRALVAAIAASLLAILHGYSPLRLSSVLPYAGLIVVITGLVCLIHPLRTLFVRTRKAALCLMAAGFVGAALGLFWPTSTTTVLERKSLLDQAMPQYEFVEHHQIRVHAPPREAYSALQAVTLDELAAYPILMKIRSGAMGRRWSKAAGPSPAILAVFSDPGSGYVLIERNEREMVFGGVGRVVASTPKPVLTSPQAFASFQQSGCVMVA